ncbi:hypothetical protein JAAARDRAFT_201025 [Jaapia argillacea MUCL 33604]|uniref:Uncharacterized protein n=1 Tax=Jaapia argillacea MUCL 33604 TaxID=933084 RepID=A0A067P383_9AGAM|nr:hypothetical protein JAAARDRAFT_201025 [Jaapia argillacea MUCL 33604]
MSDKFSCKTAFADRRLMVLFTKLGVMMLYMSRCVLTVDTAVLAEYKKWEVCPPKPSVDWKEFEEKWCFNNLARQLIQEAEAKKAAARCCDLATTSVSSSSTLSSQSTTALSSSSKASSKSGPPASAAVTSSKESEGSKEEEVMIIDPPVS